MLASALVVGCGGVGGGLPLSPITIGTGTSGPVAGSPGIAAPRSPATPVTPPTAGGPAQPTPAPVTPPPAGTPPATPPPAGASPAPAPATPPPSTAGGQFLSDQAALILQLTNNARSQAGVKALTGDTALDRLAASRSQDMGDHNYFSHTSPGGQDVFDMLRQLGISFTSAGENIAMNSASATSTGQTAFNGWMNSSGHKANILNTTYGHLGVGVYRTSRGVTYLTQVFKN